MLGFLFSAVCGGEGAESGCMRFLCFQRVGEEPPDVAIRNSPDHQRTHLAAEPERCAIKANFFAAKAKR